MKRNEIELLLTQIFSVLLKREVMTDEVIDRSSEPNWDSLLHLDLIMTVESEFNTQLSVDEIEKCISKDALAEILGEHIGADA